MFQTLFPWLYDSSPSFGKREASISLLLYFFCSRSFCENFSYSNRISALACNVLHSLHCTCSFDFWLGGNYQQSERGKCFGDRDYFRWRCGVWKLQRNLKRMGFKWTRETFFYLVPSQHEKMQSENTNSLRNSSRLSVCIATSLPWHAGSCINRSPLLADVILHKS